MHDCRHTFASFAIAAIGTHQTCRRSVRPLQPRQGRRSVSSGLNDREPLGSACDEGRPHHRMGGPTRRLGRGRHRSPQSSRPPSSDALDRRGSSGALGALGSDRVAADPLPRIPPIAGRGRTTSRPTCGASPTTATPTARLAQRNPLDHSDSRQAMRRGAARARPHRARPRESLGWHAQIGIGVAVASTVFLAFSLVTGLGEPATYISMAVGSLVTALYAERRRRRA